MKTIIAGSREGVPLGVVENTINLCPWDITEIVSGGAIGVDKVAVSYAKASDIKLTIMLPRWEKWGKRAGFLRNTDMAEYADALIAIQYNGSKGTEHMIKEAKRLGLKTYIVRIEA